LAADATSPHHTSNRAGQLEQSERVFDTLRLVPDLSSEEAEILRRSIAMLPPQAPSGLSREHALAILGQLVRALRELWRR